jgi:hypothetical protein
MISTKNIQIIRVNSKIWRHLYAWLIWLCSVTLLTSCLADYGKPIGGTYQLVRLNVHEVRIISSDGPRFGIHGNIKLWALKAPYVTGYTTPLEGCTPREAAEQTGFFLLNTNTQQILDTLTEEQWRTELKRVGWSNPTLKEPPLTSPL